MDKMRLIGRENECQRLEQVMNAQQAQLVVVYGRRRVGKTYLIEHFFQGNFDFRLTGLYHESTRKQIHNFCIELNRRRREKQDDPKDWMDAFVQLREYLESLPSGEDRVLFFDEMPWMDTKNSDFLSSFECFWNGWGAQQERLKCIVCGSATSWMVQKIGKNKGGLFNRQTCKLYLHPFDLHETEQFLCEVKGIEWTRYDIARCYMVMGGIPYYLNLLDSSMTLNENVDNLFFSRNGELWDEFDNLYATLFSNSERYISVVNALSEKRYGMTREEISEKTGLQLNGVLTKMLNDLENSDFISVSTPYNKKKRGMIYQLSDYYTIFYYRFLKGNYGRDERTWENNANLPARKVWEGLTFELICRQHIPQIKQKLGIAGVLTDAYTLNHPADEESEGVQIDLILDRQDNVVDLCEVKCLNGEYEIDKAEDLKLRNKMQRFVKVTKCRKTVRLVAVTTYGVQKNKYCSLVSNEVTLDDLFEKNRY